MAFVKIGDGNDKILHKGAWGAASGLLLGKRKDDPAGWEAPEGIPPGVAIFLVHENSNGSLTLYGWNSEAEAWQEISGVGPQGPQGEPGPPGPQGEPAPFTPISVNEFGTHPSFVSQAQLNAWMLQYGQFVAPVVTEITVQSADFAYNVYDRPYTEPVSGVTYNKHSSLAAVSFATDAPKVTFSLYSLISRDGFAGPDSMCSIFDAAGNFVTAIQPAAGEGLQVIESDTLPGSGMRTFYIVESGSTVMGTGAKINDFRGTTIVKMAVGTGYTIGLVPLVRKPNRMVITGDSITIGDGTDNDSRYGWPVVARGLLGNTWEVATDAWGVRYAASMDTTQLRQEQIDRITTYMIGATGRKILNWFLHSNDWGVWKGDPAIMATRIAAIWDGVHAADPTIEILLLTAIRRGNPEQTNTNGYLLEQYRQALRDLAATRSYVSVLEGKDILVLGGGSTDFNVDSVHPSNTGAAKIATAVVNKINALPVVPTVSFTATSPTQIAATFSVPVTATMAGFSFKKNGATLAATGISGSGTTWTFAVSGLTNTDTITAGYDAAVGNTVDGSGNEPATFANVAVANNVPGGTFVVLADKTFTDTSGWTFYKTGDAGNACEVVGGQAHLKLVAGTVTVFKQGIFTPGDTLRITVYGVNIVSGTAVVLTSNSAGAGTQNPLANGTNVFTYQTQTPTTYNHVMLAPSVGGEFYCTRIVVEKQV